MTISNTKRLVEERTRPPAPPNGQYPAPRLYPAPEFPFKGWQPPQPDGYRQSAGTPADSAIVIDTGK